MTKRRGWRRTGLALLAGAFVAAAGLAQQPAPDAAASRPAPDAASVVGAPAGAALSGAALDALTDEVAALLRCPVCQGLSVADSPSGMAQNMKAQVRDLLAAGYTQEQVLAYFERSYGEFVRLEPPLRGVNWIVWLAPVLGLVAGGLVVRWALARPHATAEPVPDDGPPAADALPDDPQLAAYVLKVRERAYGWPGGVPPQEPEA